MSWTALSRAVLELSSRSGVMKSTRPPNTLLNLANPAPAAGPTFPTTAKGLLPVLPADMPLLLSDVPPAAAPKEKRPLEKVWGTESRRIPLLWCKATPFSRSRKHPVVFLADQVYAATTCVSTRSQQKKYRRLAHDLQRQGASIPAMNSIGEMENVTKKRQLWMARGFRILNDLHSRYGS